MFRFTSQVAISSLVALLLSTGLKLAWAQALPQAGEVNRQAQPSLPARESASPVQAPPIAAPIRAAAVAAISIQVTAFKFTGNYSIGNEELQALVADKINQKIDFAGLDAVADRISRHYRTKGYTVARAYLPPQQSIDGSIQIAVIEGVYEQLNLQNTSSIASERLQKMMNRNVCLADDCKGITIHDIGLERAVLLIKDLPGVTAVASLKPGVAQGTSDLDIVVKDVKQRAYTVGFDNYGASSTGVVRLNASADLNNLRNDGDQLSLGLATTGKKTNTGSISYAMPLGYDGVRAGLAFARSQYRLGAGFEATLSHGTSNSLSAFGSYPILRGINQSLYVRGSLETRAMYDSVDLTNTFYPKYGSAVRVGLSGDHVDDLLSGGYNTYGATLTSGYLGLKNPVNSAADLAGANTQGRYAKLAYNFARQQAIAGPTTVYASLIGQKAGHKNLDGSEQIGIGGPGAVRGYGGEAGGSTGAIGTLELRYTQPVVFGNLPQSNMTYAVYYDRGWVDVYANTAVLARSTRSLGGYGVSLTLQSVGYYLRAMYAGHRASEPSVVEPAVTNKFWLQGSMTF